MLLRTKAWYILDLSEEQTSLCHLLVVRAIGVWYFQTSSDAQAWCAGSL